MQQWIDLNTKIVNDNLAVLKQFGEINKKAAESLFAEQKEIADGYSAAAKENMKKLSEVKDQSAYLDLQNEIFQSSVTSALGSFKKSVEVSTSSQAAYRELAEETMKTMKGNLEQAAATAKEATATVAETAKQAAKPATKAKAKKA